MKMRQFGNTGMMVSEIGLGAWQLANPDWNLHDRGEAIRIVHRSLEAGCNFFDTAPGYGNGRSEELLGQALQGHRAEVVICTKFGHHPDFRAELIRTSLEGSLQRLQTDYVDILLLHNPPRELMDGRVAERQFAELEQLQREGKIRAFGISLDWEVELQTMLDTTRSQAAEVMYNAFYQEPAGAFSRAQAQGVGLIIKVPLDSGWLSGRYRGVTQFEDVRSRWPREVLERRARLLEQFAGLVPSGTSLTHAALQFILARPEVSTIIPGAKNVEQALDNFAAAENQLSPEVVHAIQALWDREIQPDPLPW